MNEKHKNPFEEVFPYVMDETISKNLSIASVMWDGLTDNGEHPDDECLYTVLFGNDLDDIQVSYELYRKGEAFDSDALYNALYDWVMSIH